MANYKRKKPKNARGGCLMCKHWKINGHSKNKPDHEKFSDHKRRMFAEEEIKTNYPRSPISLLS